MCDDSGPSIDTTAVELRRIDEPVELDRGHAVHLTGPAAANLSDSLGQATREGLRIARKARLYELVQSKDLDSGIRSGALRRATSAQGDASVLIKDQASGRIAGQSQLKKVSRKPASVLGPAAWQALAMATQQHYLVEISAKLDGLQEGIDEVLARMDDDRIGTLNHISEKAADAREEITRSGWLPASRVSELRRDADDAKRLWHQGATTARRHLAEYRNGTRTAEQVERSFVFVLHVTRALAQCSEAILALPCSTTEALEQAFIEEQDRLHPALPQVAEMLDEVLGVSGHWRGRNVHYEVNRPTGRLQRGWNHLAPVGKIGPAKPEQRPISASGQETFGSIAAVDHKAPPAQLVVEIQEDGSVLVAPRSP